MRTYVKIEGKDIGLIVQKLAKLAVDSPEICVWDYNILNAGWGTTPMIDERLIANVAGYFEMEQGVFEKECDNIIAKSGADLGDNDLYFEWQKEPSNDQLKSLRGKIDNIIKPFGNKYTVTNKK